MDVKDLISLGSLIISIIAILYTIFANTKKYELSSAQRKDVLEWYSKVIVILIELRSCIQNNIDVSKKENLLVNLSALIEVGRFYFPNVDKHDNFGHKKPLAYRGYRNIVLEFLVYSYDICKLQDSQKYVMHLNALQRQFTSYVFEVLRTAHYMKLVKHYTGMKLNKEIILEDFLESDPNNYNFFSLKG